MPLLRTPLQVCRRQQNKAGNIGIGSEETEVLCTHAKSFAIIKDLRTKIFVPTAANLARKCHVINGGGTLHPRKQSLRAACRRATRDATHVYSNSLDAVEQYLSVLWALTTNSDLQLRGIGNNVVLGAAGMSPL